MADYSLRDLVVSLSLKTDNFSTNIKHLNSLIKETKSIFELAKAGVDGFESTTEGAAAKMKQLESTFQHQTGLVKAYGDALRDAEQKLENAVALAPVLQEKFEASGNAARAAAIQHRELGNALKSAVATGDMAQIASLSAAYEESEATLRALREEHTKYGVQINRNAATQQRLADTVTNARANYNDAQAAVKATADAIGKLSVSMEPAQERYRALSDAVAASKAAFESAGGNIRVAESELAKYAATSGAAPTSAEYLNEQLRVMNTVMAEQGAQARACQDVYNALAAQYEILRNDSSATAEQLNAQNAAVQNAAVAMNKADAAYARTVAEVEALTAALTPQAQAWEAAKVQMELSGAAIDRASAGIALSKAEFAAFAASTSAAPDSVAFLTTQLSHLNDVLANQRGAMSEYAKQIDFANTHLTALQSSSSATEKEISAANTEVTRAKTAYANAAASVAKTEKEIDDLRQALSREGQAWTAQQRAVEAAAAGVNKYEQSMKLLLAEQSALREEQKSSTTEVQQLRTHLDQLSEVYRRQTDAIRLYREAATEAATQLRIAQNSNDPTRIQEASEAYNDAARALANARESAAGTKNEMAELKREIDDQSLSWGNVASAMQSFGDTCSGIGNALYSNVTSRVKDFAAESEEAYMTMEMAEARLRQVAYATEDQYATVIQSARQMSEELGMSAASIVNVMTEVGRLGINIEGNGEDFIAFTRTVEQMALTLGVSAEDAGTSAARFFTLMGNSTSEISNYGSAVTYLANNYATTASEIIEMSQGLAGAGKTVGMSAQDILGVSTALTSVGITAGRGATTFSQALVKIQTSVDTGDKYLAEFARVAGMSADEFVNAWRNDPTEVFTRFIIGLASMDNETASAISALQECGIKTARLTDSFLRITNNTEQFTRAIRDSNTAWDDTIILEGTAGKITSTLTTKLNNLRQTFTNYKEKIGKDLAPTFSTLIDKGNELLTWLNDMDPAMRTLIEQIAGAAAAVGPAVIAIGLLSKGLGTGMAAIASFASGVKTAVTVVGTLVSAIGAGNILLFAAGAAALYAAKQIFEYTTGIKDARDRQNELNDAVKQWGENVETAYEKAKGLSAFNLDSNLDFGIKFTDATADAAKAGESAGNAWLDALVAVWTDGEKETDDILKQWIASTNISDIKSGIVNATEKDGILVTQEAKNADIKRLTEIDERISAILTKRQNGFLTDKDKKELNELYNEKHTIAVSYQLTEAAAGATSTLDGVYGQIETGISAAITRGADNKAVWANAFSAINTSLGEYLDQLNAEFDNQYAQIMGDPTLSAGAKTERIDALKAWYGEQGRAAAESYNSAMFEAMSQTGVNFDASDSSNPYAGVIEKMQRIRELLSSGVDLSDTTSDGYKDLQEILTALGGEESTVVELVAALSGLGTAAETAGIDLATINPQASELLDTVKMLHSIASGENGNFGVLGDSITSMFGDNLTEEVAEVSVGLNADYLEAEYRAWAENGEHASIVPTLDTESLANVTISATGGVTITDENGATISTAGGISINGSTGAVVAVTADGAEVTPGTITLSAGENTTITGDSSTWGVEVPVESIELTVTDGKITSISGVSAEGEVVTNLRDKDGKPITIDNLPVAAKTVLTNADITYDPGENLFEIPVVAKITAYDKTELPEYDDAGTAFTGARTAVGALSFDERTRGAADDLFDAIEKYVGDRAAEMSGNMFQRILPAAWAGSTGDIIRSMLASDDGAEIANAMGTYVSSGLQQMKSDSFATPEAKAAFVSFMNDLMTMIDPGQVNFDTKTGAVIRQALFSALNDGATEDVDTTTFSQEMVAYYNDALGATEAAATEAGTRDGAAYANAVKEGVRTAMPENSGFIFDAPETKGDSSGGNPALTAAIANSVSASEAEAAQSPTVKSGAEHLASSAIADVKTAVEAGEGDQVGFGSVLSESMSTANNELNPEVDVSDAKVTGATNVGAAIARGIANGINSSLSVITNAARTAAQAALNAAKAELGIHSPSRVFRDEVGAMMMKGLGLGVTEESAEQGRVIGNAMRYLTNDALAYAGAGGGNTTNNTRNYNDSSSVNVSGNFYVRSDQDIEDLAVEIASLTRSQQRGRGIKR